MRFVRFFFLIAVSMPLVLQSTQQATGAEQSGPTPLKAKSSKSKPPEIKIPKTGELTDFSDWVTSVAFSPDGKLLAAGTYESVTLWNVESQKKISSLKIPSGYARAIAFSPDGSQLAAGCYQQVILWNHKTGETSLTLKGHRGYVTGLSFSPKGSHLATSSDDQTVRIWTLNDGAVHKILKDFKYPVTSVAYSPDGKLLATTSGDDTRVTKPGPVNLWNAESGQLAHKLVPHEKSSNSVAFSPDGQFLVSTGVDEKINVYEVKTGKAHGYFSGHQRPTTAAVFASKGTRIVSSSGGRAKGGNVVKIWDPKTGEEFATIDGHKGKISDLALSSDESLLATAGYDKTVMLWSVLEALALGQTEKKAEAPKKEMKIGIIGLDTSHVIAFTKILNAKKKDDDVLGYRIVAAYPKGSPDIESSTSRVPEYTKEMKEMGVKIVDSIEELCQQVDAVLLESNDGRPHLEQVIPVLKAGKPVFIDKPVAGSLADAVAIYELSKLYKVPVFSASSLRFSEGAQALRNGKLGKILGCDAYSPCSLEKTHPDLFWYGIHGVETLFTVMGAGCESVTRASTDDFEVVTGKWSEGRIGTFRGIRKGGGGYGGTAFGEKGVSPIGSYGGYKPLLVEILKFFTTGKEPVSAQETLEIYAFMEAADESKRQGGKPVTLESVFKKAQEEAAGKIKKYSPKK